MYVIFVGVRTKEVLGNHSDDAQKNLADEKYEQEENLENLERIGLASSGRRIKSEKRIQEKFTYERRKEIRQFHRKLFDCLLLKD